MITESAGLKGLEGCLLLTGLGITGNRGFGRIPKLFIHKVGRYGLGMCILVLSLELVVILTEWTLSSQVLIRNLPSLTSNHSTWWETQQW